MNLRRNILPISAILFLGLAACSEGDLASSGSGPDAGDIPGDHSGDPGSGGSGDSGDSNNPGDAGDAGDSETGELPANPEDNLVDNPGFEAGSPGDGCPEAWECVTYNPSGAGTFATTGDDARRGDQAARWSGDEEAAVVMKQPHPASAGDAFQAAAYYRAENTSAAPFVQVIFHDASGAELDWEIFEGEAGTTEWQRIVTDKVRAPIGTDRVQINLSLNGSAGTVLWDEAVLVDVTGDGDLPPADFEVIEADGRTIHIGDNEVFENVLIDLTTGQGISIDAKNSTNWTIRNVGFRGQNRAPGGLIGLSDTGGGHSVFENVYMGDGSTRAGGQPTCPDTDCTHGPTGIHIGPEHNGHITIRRLNIQGWPDNGVYGSAPGFNAGAGRGSVHIDQSYGANNYVSTFRLAGGQDQLTDSVAYNSGEGYNGRPVWVWPDGPVTIDNVNVSAGSFGGSIFAGANGQATVVDLQNSEIAGPLQPASGSTINRENVGSDPDLSMPAGVPQTAEEAASGRAGH